MGHNLLSSVDSRFASPVNWTLDTQPIVENYPLKVKRITRQEMGVIGSI